MPLIDDAVKEKLWKKFTAAKNWSPITNDVIDGADMS